VGSLEPGKHADIVAVSENPLKSPTVVDKISFVMKAGDVVRNDLE
jgi:imidazolonepropionase-like amidohydrolase